MRQRSGLRCEIFPKQKKNVEVVLDEFHLIGACLSLDKCNVLLFGSELGTISNIYFAGFIICYTRKVYMIVKCHLSEYITKLKNM